MKFVHRLVLALALCTASSAFMLCRSFGAVASARTSFQVAARVRGGSSIPPLSQLMSTANNPLLETSTLPLFDKTTAADVEPGIKFALEKPEADVSALEANLSRSKSATYADVVEVRGS